MEPECCEQAIHIAPQRGDKLDRLVRDRMDQGQTSGVEGMAIQYDVRFFVAGDFA